MEAVEMEIKPAENFNAHLHSVCSKMWAFTAILTDPRSAVTVHAIRLGLLSLSTVVDSSLVNYISPRYKNYAA